MGVVRRAQVDLEVTTAHPYVMQKIALHIHAVLLDLLVVTARLGSGENSVKIIVLSHV